MQVSRGSQGGSKCKTDQSVLVKDTEYIFLYLTQWVLLIVGSYWTNPFRGDLFWDEVVLCPGLRPRRLRGEYRDRVDSEDRFCRPSSRGFDVGGVLGRRKKKRIPERGRVILVRTGIRPCWVFTPH